MNTASSKALIADDNPGFRALLEKMLAKWGYQTITAPDGTRALEILSGDDPPRLAILDWIMPGMHGPEVCRKIRELNREPYIYILLLTAKDTAEELVEGMDAGADDYLTKPVDSHELQVRVRAGQRIVELQQELVEAREALRCQVMRDPLTGLWNRKGLGEILPPELERAQRQSAAVSVIMLDPDGFRQVDDTLGHEAADLVLAEVARRISGHVRPYDSICRYGSEEFLIVLPGCELADAAVRAEEIRTAVAVAPFQLPQGPIEITCSLGVAGTAAGVPCGESALIGQAGEALRRAKDGGLNRVEVFTPRDLVEAGS